MRRAIEAWWKVKGSDSDVGDGSEERKVQLEAQCRTARGPQVKLFPVQEQTLSTQSSQAFLPTDSTAGPDDLQYESDYNDDLS